MEASAMENLKSRRKETADFCNAKTSVIITVTEEQKRILPDRVHILCPCCFYGRRHRPKSGEVGLY